MNFIQNIFVNLYIEKNQNRWKERSNVPSTQSNCGQHWFSVPSRSVQCWSSGGSKHIGDIHAVSPLWQRQCLHRPSNHSSPLTCLFPSLSMHGLSTFRMEKKGVTQIHFSKVSLQREVQAKTNIDLQNLNFKEKLNKKCTVIDYEQMEGCVQKSGWMLDFLNLIF